MEPRSNKVCGRMYAAHQRSIGSRSPDLMRDLVREVTQAPFHIHRFQAHGATCLSANALRRPELSLQLTPDVDTIHPKYVLRRRCEEDADIPSLNQSAGSAAATPYRT